MIISDCRIGMIVRKKSDRKWCQGPAEERLWLGEIVDIGPEYVRVRWTRLETTAPFELERIEP